MKTWTKLLATCAGVMLVSVLAWAGEYSRTVSASNGGNDYNTIDVSVPAGTAVSYYIYSSGSGGYGQVSVSGPGVNISDSLNGPGSVNDTEYTNASGDVTGNLYVSTSGSGVSAGANVSLYW